MITRLKALPALILLAVLFVPWAGCATEAAPSNSFTTGCEPGGQQSCECTNGPRGVRVCSSDGKGYGECAGCGDGGTVNPECANCQGCCSATGCVTFGDQSSAVCGGAGGNCKACGTGKSCAAGTCVTTTTQCSAMTGANYCCIGVQQVTTSAQDSNRCGNGGAPCAACPNGGGCVNGACSGASMGIDDNAQFKIRVKSIQSQTTKASGSKWDVALTGPGLPELYVEFKNASGDGWNTETPPECADSATCTPNATEGLVVPKGSGTVAMLVTGKDLKAGIDIIVWDKDLVNDDQVGAKMAFPITSFQTSYKTGAFDQVIEVEFEIFQ